MTQKIQIRGGFVYADGVKICRVGRRGELIFFDKDPRRSKMRGTANITIQAAELLAASQKAAE